MKALQSADRALTEALAIVDLLGQVAGLGDPDALHEGTLSSIAGQLEQKIATAHACVLAAATILEERPLPP